MNDKCFWCGENISNNKFKELRIGGVPKKFHVEMFKDCRNEFQKFQQRNEPRLQLITRR
jgi:hypothetical protein